MYSIIIVPVIVLTIAAVLTRFKGIAACLAHAILNRIRIPRIIIIEGLLPFWSSNLNTHATT